MTLYRLLTAILILTGSIVEANEDSPSMPTVYIQPALFDGSGRPSDPLLRLLEATGVSHDGSQADIVTATQKCWLRPRGTERWQLEDHPALNREQIVELLRQLGSVDAVQPTKSHYRYGIVHGGGVDSVRSRIDFLVSLWNEGVRFDYIVFLTASRPLDPRIEGVAQLRLEGSDLPIPTTEAEMMRLVFSQTDVPEGMKALPLQVIDVPMLPNGQGGIRRANTQDTILAWLATDPAPGSAVVVSNQPFIGYQDAVWRTLVPESLEADTVGPAAGSNVLVAVYLDNLARWIYQNAL
jgi:hypothetical protein